LPQKWQTRPHAGLPSDRNTLESGDPVVGRPFGFLGHSVGDFLNPLPNAFICIQTGSIPPVRLKPGIDIGVIDRLAFGACLSETFMASIF
jgi:hypothetical protein